MHVAFCNCNTITIMLQSKEIRRFHPPICSQLDSIVPGHAIAASGLAGCDFDAKTLHQDSHEMQNASLPTGLIAPISVRGLGY